jgi:UDP-2,3-diacylglucosamine pyrophosphatase LpxH
MNIDFQSLPVFDELHVISDLHLGGAEGFQIFNQTDRLRALLKHLGEYEPGKKVGLVINGDMVDFLAESASDSPPKYLCVADAEYKLGRIFENFARIWEALHGFLKNANRFLAITLGNHSLELALPWVRERLLQKLSDDDPAARGRITLAFDGSGFLCKVGEAKVLCVHGNETDPWNATDYEALRRVGRNASLGMDVPPWRPCAGTKMVVDVMNEIKKTRPFVDLLKPETEGVPLALLALDLKYLSKIDDVLGLVVQKEWDKHTQDTMLSVEGEAPAREPEEDTISKETYVTNLLYKGFPSFEAHAKAEDARAMLAQVDALAVKGETPSGLLQKASGEEYLGLFGQIYERFKRFVTGREDRTPVLREALENLANNRCFDIDDRQKDDAFKYLDERVGPGIHFLVAGHTHLERAICREKGRRFYFNSGAWARLIQITKKHVASDKAFASISRALQASTLAELDKIPESGVLIRSTLVSVWKDGDKVRGQLRHATDTGTPPWVPAIDDEDKCTFTWG